MLTDYYMRHVKYDMELNYIHTYTLCGKYCYIKDMTLRFYECVRLQATYLMLTEQFFTIIN